MTGLLGWLGKPVKEEPGFDVRVEPAVSLEGNTSFGETLKTKDQFSLRLLTPHSSKTNQQTNLDKVLSGSTLKHNHSLSDSTVSTLTTQSTLISFASTSSNTTSAPAAWGGGCCTAPYANYDDDQDSLPSYLRDDSTAYMDSCCDETQQGGSTMKHSLEATVTTRSLDPSGRLKILRSDTSLFDGIIEDEIMEESIEHELAKVAIKEAPKETSPQKKSRKKNSLRSLFGRKRRTAD